MVFSLKYFLITEDPVFGRFLDGERGDRLYHEWTLARLDIGGEAELPLIPESMELLSLNAILGCEFDSSTQVRYLEERGGEAA